MKKLTVTFESKLEVNAMNFQIFFDKQKIYIHPQVTCVMSSGKSAFHIPEHCFYR